MIKHKLKREAEEKENAFFALGGVPVGMAIAEEEEMSASSLSRKENQKK